MVEVTVMNDKLYNHIEQTITGLTEIVLEKTLIKIVNVAKRNAPVDTGILKGSIGYKIGDTVKPGEKGEQITEQTRDRLSGVVGTPVEYAPYQEFGTRNRPPHPFIRPAVDYVVKNEDFKKAQQKYQDQYFQQKGFKKV